MSSSPLHSLVQALDRAERLDSASLASQLEALADAERLLQRARFSKDRYQRLCLYLTPDYEIRMLCWLPGQSSALHEHGASACALRVLAGTATETLLDSPDRQITAGEVAETSPGGVHQVANLGEQPLVTLHLYAPPLPIDQPSSPRGRRIAIVGGGLEATALAVQLLASRDPTLRITLISTDQELARGLVRDTEDDNHLLEHPAASLSLDPERPDDFLEYARLRRDGAVDEGALLPRSLFRDYVTDRLAQAIAASPGKARILRDEAVNLLSVGDNWQIALASGRTLQADEVVLTAPSAVRVPQGLGSLRGDERLVSDPFAPGALDPVLLFERLLVVGAGPAAADLLVTLRARGHLGPVTLASPEGRGALPPSVAELIEAWQAEGWLTLLQGEVTAASQPALEVSVAGRALQPDRVLLCTGDETDPRRFQQPLWQQVLARELVLVDPLGLGLLTRDDHSVLSPAGHRLWALGSLERPRVAEASAVATLVRHARELASTLVHELAPLPALLPESHGDLWL